MKKYIILFTHNDLDGVFCGVLANLSYGTYGDAEVIIYYCGYADINEKVTKFINEDLKKLTGDIQIYITDISVKPETAELIDKVNGRVLNTQMVNVKLLDHHGNDETLALNKYDWATVETQMTYDKSRKTSGTYMFFEELKDFFEEECNPQVVSRIEYFADMVRRYDTWEWANSGDDMPNKLNMLLRIFPRRMFVERFSDIARYTQEDTAFDELESTLIEIDEEKRKTHIKNKLKEVELITVDEKCAAVVISEDYINDLAHEMCAVHKNAEFAVVVTPKAFSFRTDGKTDVSEIARKFGGNGHKAAAGAPIPPDVRRDMLKDLFFMAKEEISNETSME